MQRMDISTWLCNSLFVLLISAIAMMGMWSMVVPEKVSGISDNGLASIVGAIGDRSLPNQDGLLPMAMVGAGKACCACDGDGCSLERPPAENAQLFMAALSVRFDSLTSQPPAAPPRT